MLAESNVGKKAGLLHLIYDALRQVIDPELGYNIFDLGLIYDVDIEDGGAVRVLMTTTTPGCPATSYLKGGADQAVSSVPGVESVYVELTHDPRWSPALMSQDAKEHFGIRDGEGW